ncbi:MAG TPA: (5-formylfuran-3-yl)methyl phosphate synthase [Planctomycetaceae bacterium]|nr:(5-formylfuran-3-yl)methyl phosphate synthase [Planctomycetaceae bacterium]
MTRTERNAASTLPLAGLRTPPVLLVSVRDAAEARAAAAGGCDILDVKEPRRGPLGMAEPATMDRVLAAASGPAGGNLVPVSSALGEAREWTEGRSVPPLPLGLAFVKLGLAGLGQRAWVARWRSVRARFDQAAGRQLAWIAVAYADWRAVAAPRPEAVVEAAIETRCAGVLFDTFAKDGRDLLDHVDHATLRSAADLLHGQRLILALAGSVTAELLPDVCQAQPDVIAVRGAVCTGGVRNSAVDAAAVCAFRKSLDSCRSFVRRAENGRRPEA